MLHLRLACTAHQQAVLTSAQKTLTEVGQRKLAACTGAQNGGAGLDNDSTSKTRHSKLSRAVGPICLRRHVVGTALAEEPTGCYALRTETRSINALSHQPLSVSWVPADHFERCARSKPMSTQEPEENSSKKKMKENLTNAIVFSTLKRSALVKWSQQPSIL